MSLHSQVFAGKPTTPVYVCVYIYVSYLKGLCLCVCVSSRLAFYKYTISCVYNPRSCVYTTHTGRSLKKRLLSTVFKRGNSDHGVGLKQLVQV